MPFPTVIDNTIRKSFWSCPTQAMYRHIDNIRPTGPDSVDLLFGASFATGVEVARKMFFVFNLDVEHAIDAGITAATTQYGDFQPPDKSNKTKVRLIGALRYYFEQWPLGEDGLTPFPNGIECMFDIEIPILHPDTGEPLRYAGRYDMLATDTNNRLYVVDEKTTSQLGNSWNAQWDLDPQMTGYIWSVLYMNGYRVGEPETAPEIEVMAQIRGVSILLRDYGHAEIPLVRPLWMIDRWYYQMLRDVARMKKSYISGEWDVSLNGNDCVAYRRPCDYMTLCRSANPERLIEGNYKEVIWNPIAIKP